MTTERIPIGTLVWMTAATAVKECVIEEHGNLWTVQGYDPTRPYRIHKLKSLATGYEESFNITGLEFPDKEHDHGASDTTTRSY